MANIYYLYNGLLCTLQVLHIFWFYIILKMAYFYVIKGQVSLSTEIYRSVRKSLPLDGYFRSAGSGSLCHEWLPLHPASHTWRFKTDYINSDINWSVIARLLFRRSRRTAGATPNLNPIPRSKSRPRSTPTASFRARTPEILPTGWPLKTGSRDPRRSTLDDSADDSKTGYVKKWYLRIGVFLCT